jgi:hypothetical protein
VGRATVAPARPASADQLDWPEVVESVLRLPSPPSGFWYGMGLSPRAERRMEIAFGILLYVLAVGWVWSLSHLRTSLAAGEVDSAPSAAVRAAASVASALTNTDAPTTAYLTDATLNALFESARGLSGKLKAVIDTAGENIEPDSLPAGAELRYSESGDVSPADTEPKGAGVWSVAVAIGNAIKPIADFSVITMEPFSAKSKGRIGLYYIGNWPAEKSRGKVGPSKAPSTAYANPSGFIQVTPQNEDTYVSEHFRLRDFLTHDQPNVWPKYIVLQLKLVDKLELVLEDLAAHGVDVSGVKVMSGFRTPQYNATGGNPQGRAALSRHMYGDAADIYIDDNHDGLMDDLDHDGRITMNDAKVILAAEERVEAAHPELVGGGGIYPAGPGHGPFIHIDTRGYRARWTGGPGGG